MTLSFIVLYKENRTGHFRLSDLYEFNIKEKHGSSLQEFPQCIKIEAVEVASPDLLVLPDIILHSSGVFKVHNKASHSASFNYAVKFP